MPYRVSAPESGTHHGNFDAAVGFEKKIAGHRANEIWPGTKPGLVVQLVEEREGLLDPRAEELARLFNLWRELIYESLIYSRT